MRFTSRQRLGAAIMSAATTAVLVLTASPATAADGGWIQPQFEVDSTTIPAHSASPRTIVADALATGPFTNASVIFDFSGLAGVASATIAAASHCTVSGTTATCPIADITDDTQLNPDFPITVVSDPAAADGASGSISMTVTADGLEFDSGTETTDVVVSDKPALNTPPNSDFEKPASIGDVVSLPISIANMGSKPAAGVEMLFDVSHGILPETYDNCLYATWSQIDGTYVACTFPGSVAPGVQLKLAKPFQGTIAADAAEVPRIDMFVTETAATTPTPPDDPELSDVHFAARPSSGHVLSLAPEAFDGTITGDGYSLGMTWDYRVDAKADLAADGDHVSGQVGDVVTATVGVTNNGPAVRDSFSSQEEPADVWFTVPTWGTVVTVPAGCRGTNSVTDGPNGSKPGMLFYQCTPVNIYFMAVGQTFSYTFGLRIKAATGADGTVDAYMYGLANPNDPVVSNNVAALTATITTPTPPTATPTGKQGSNKKTTVPPPGYHLISVVPAG